MILIFTGFRAREEATCFAAHHDCRVIFIGGQYIVAMLLKGVFDHLEQGFILFLTINRPVSIENLVTAVLGVGLREHIEFDIVRVATQFLETGQQIVDFIFCQRQTQFNVGFHQRFTTTTQYIN